LKQNVVRVAPMFALAAALAGVVAGCDSPTILAVTVGVRDNSVPFFTQLVIKISSVADPSRQLSQMFISTAPGYGAEGGLPSVAIPVRETFNIEPSYLSGQVLVQAQGVEIYGGTVVAQGAVTADLVPNQTTNVTVTLHGLGSCGGPTVDGGVDAGAPCDGGADASF